MENIPKITCPECGAEFKLTDSLEKDIQEHIQKDFEEKYQVKLEKLSQKEKVLEKERESISEKVQKQLKEEEKKLKEQLKKDIVDESIEENKVLKEDLKKTRENLKEIKIIELENEKLKSKLENQATEIEVKLRKELSKDSDRIVQNKIKKIEIEKKEMEEAYKQQINSMKKDIEVLQSKSEQKSPKIQGEVQELLIQRILEEQFPNDEFEEVKSGKIGSDIIQTIIHNGKKEGVIAWESKKTKNWSNDWIDKFKKDIEEAKADLGILISKALPKDIEGIGIKDDIWIADFSLLIPVAYLLRNSLIEIMRSRRAANIQDEQLNVLYNYIISKEFVSKIQNIVKSFQSMKEDLDKEKTAMEKNWSKREKQIEMVIKNTAKLYGELQGQLGNKLPEVKSLELSEE